MTLTVTEELARNFFDSTEDRCWIETLEDGNRYCVYDQNGEPNYTLTGKIAYFSALLIGKEIEVDATKLDEDLVDSTLSYAEVYIGYPIIEEDDPRFNPEPNEFNEIYDMDAPMLL